MPSMDVGTISQMFWKIDTSFSATMGGFIDRPYHPLQIAPLDEENTPIGHRCEDPTVVASNIDFRASGS